ncbi:MAG: GGDEF domain-containing protein [Lachnospiraceae bacterium]|nr:GGDEF domain-containing protein [Lachnospiraceae bacterium]
MGDFFQNLEKRQFSIISILFVLIIILFGIQIVSSLAVFGQSRSPLIENSQISFTKTTPIQQNGKTFYKGTLIFSNQQQNTLCFKTIYASYDLKILNKEGREVGSFSSSPIYKNGSLWNFITVPSVVEQPFSGAAYYVSISLDSEYSNVSSQAPVIIVGSRSDCISYLMRHSTWKSILSLCLILMGFVFVSLWAFLHYNESVTKSILYLGFLAICFGFWSLEEAGLLSLFISNITLIYYMKMISIILTPCAVVAFFREFFSLQETRSLSAMLHSAMIFNLIIIILDISSIAHYTVTLPYIIIFFSLLILMLHLYSIYNYIVKGNKKDSAVFLIATIILGSTGLLDCILFLFGNNTDATFNTRIGSFVFILYLAFVTLRENVQKANLGDQAEAYQKLAYTDVLTSVNNRSAFYAKTSQFENEETFEDDTIFVAEFDLNNLKVLNDTFGHHVGDELIINGARIIEEAFVGYSECYRIGGDEFAIIIRNKKALSQYCKCTQKMNHLIELYNKEHEDYNLSIASGFARYNPNIDKNLQDTLSRADKIMYHTKYNMKLEASQS